MTLQYIKSQKGKDQLLYKGYLHKKERVSGGKILWKCAEYHKFRCTGRAHTCDDQVVKYSPHLHPPNKTALEVKKVEYGIQEPASGQKSIEERLTPNGDASPGAVVEKKPRIQNNPKQTIQRLRACLNATRHSTAGSQTPPSIAAKVAEGPPLPRPVTLPGLREHADGVEDGHSFPGSKTTAPPSTSLCTGQEASRQRFRMGRILPGEAPQDLLSRLSEAAQQWLCPWQHSKDQIVDMVILEQFLSVLPPGMQAWLRAREPSSSKEAVQLAETYVRELEPAKPMQDPVTFEDVSVHFTEEEWALLGCEDKALYWAVMHQNYDSVACLGYGAKHKDKEKEAFQEAATNLVMDLWRKSGKEVSQGTEQGLITEDCLERQSESYSGEEMFTHGRKSWEEVGPGPDHIEMELGLESWCPCTDCEKRAESSAQKISSEEDREVLSGELPEISQNLNQNLIQEDQNHVEKQQAKLSGKGDDNLRNLITQNIGPDRMIQCITMDSTEQDETTLLRYNIHSGEDSECVVLSGESLEMSEARISQGAKQELTKDALCSDAQPPAEDQQMHVCCRHQGVCSTCTGSQNPDSGGDLCVHPTCTRPVTQNSAPVTWPSCSYTGRITGGPSAFTKHRRFDKKHQRFKERNWCIRTALAHKRIHPRRGPQKYLHREDQGGNRQGSCRLLKPGKGLREPPKPSSVKLSTPVHGTSHPTLERAGTPSGAGASSSDPKGLDPQQGSSSLPLLDKPATESALAQLIAVLQQVAADTAEIKSAVSSLHSTITGIHDALGSLSGSTDEAEHRISHLEDTSRNTRAQLVQHCNDIKAIEARLVGKPVQSNVIAGLWSLLGAKRGASPLYLPPKS
ncbi:uncharacterized protein LOC123034520 isoform X2 [Varanus komodoensis]|uniref:uncharacterized protein LOC123034520 isoform X2 n=1 Tax=Varanus komodoensis TaxID=61221 RepID=UPI001CF7CC5B|nr:uncharacterized protein LOC123034520 isoform X2 [Varanus komodoensis]